MELDEAIKKLKKAKNKKECLNMAYDIVSKKYHGERIKTYIRIWELSYFNIKKLWLRKGFLHCTNINKVMKYLLVKSGHFKNSEIKKKWTIIVISPHQYLQINLDGQKVNVDVWGKKLGIKFGKYAHGYF